MGWDSFRVCMIVSGSSYSVCAVPSEFLFRPSTWFTAHSFFVAGPVLYCTVLSENPNHLILSDSLSSESILFYIVLFHTISPIAATSHDNYNTRTRTISQRNATQRTFHLHGVSVDTGRSLDNNRLLSEASERTTAGLTPGGSSADGK